MEKKNKLKDSIAKMSPHSIEAEQAVLGCMLINQESVSKAIQEITSNSFYDKSNAVIFENMQKFAKKNNLSFPYLYDESQQVAKKYSAVCTPDFFGYNKNSELQYRGRITEAKKLKPVNTGDTELRKAMKLIADTGKGPQEQFPSMGCGIKWFK